MATYHSSLTWRIFTDRGAWRAAVHGVSKSRTQLSHSARHTAQTSLKGHTETKQEQTGVFSLTSSTTNRNVFLPLLCKPKWRLEQQQKIGVRRFQLINLGAFDHKRVRKTMDGAVV